MTLDHIQAALEDPASWTAQDLPDPAMGRYRHPNGTTLVAAWDAPSRSWFLTLQTDHPTLEVADDFDGRLTVDPRGLVPLMQVDWPYQDAFTLQSVRSLLAFNFDPSTRIDNHHANQLLAGCLLQALPDDVPSMRFYVSFEPFKAPFHRKPEVLLPSIHLLQHQGLLDRLSASASLKQVVDHLGIGRWRLGTDAHTGRGQSPGQHNMLKTQYRIPVSIPSSAHQRLGAITALTTFLALAS